MSTKQEFIDQAKLGNILVLQCLKCSHNHLSTVYFCQKCGNKDFTKVVKKGTGRVATFTIITVPPTGFESYIPYAWVIFIIDDLLLRVSGFMADISAPSQLPIGARVKITNFDQRGLVIEKSE